VCAQGCAHTSPRDGVLASAGRRASHPPSTAAPPRKAQRQSAVQSGVQWYGMRWTLGIQNQWVASTTGRVKVTGSVSVI